MSRMLAIAVVFLSVASLFSPLNTYAQPAPAKLPPLHADKNAVSASGLSSGAFMAVQLHVAYSSSIMGVASIAGGPWGCSAGQITNAEIRCMSLTDQIKVDDLVKDLRATAAQGLIDDPENLKTSHAYLFNSLKDQTVRPPMNDQLTKFYSEFVPPSQIKSETSVPAAHGFPTVDYGNRCDQMGSPYLNSCNFDGAGEILKFLYQDRTLTKNVADAGALQTFDQTEFAKSDAQLGDSGWVYLPKACTASGAHCAVHIALHGCLQSAEAIGDVFATHAGYNEWAEGNSIIVVYPQARKGPGNPDGCWDWFGYTGKAYDTNQAPQMKAIKAMIDRITD